MAPLLSSCFAYTSYLNVFVRSDTSVGWPMHVKLKTWDWLGSLWASNKSNYLIERNEKRWPSIGFSKPLTTSVRAAKKGRWSKFISIPLIKIRRLLCGVYWLSFFEGKWLAWTLLCLLTPFWAIKNYFYAQHHEFSFPDSWVNTKLMRHLSILRS